MSLKPIPKSLRLAVIAGALVGAAAAIAQQARITDNARVPHLTHEPPIAIAEPNSSASAG